jgi:two-component system, OmpR family, phosphate regulon sensor histidine kinase PhoR
MLASVLDSMSQGVIALDPSGRVEVLNEQARKILRLNSSQIGERFADFVDVAELIVVSQATKLTESEFDLPHGTRVLVRAAPKRDVGGIVLVVEDVTNVRELETIRQDFVANVSHELRTPVAVIRANAETLSAGAKRDPEMAAKLIDGLHRNAERLARILADLLDLSRLDAGHYRLDASAVDVAAAVSQAVAAVEPLIKQRNCSIHIEVESKIQVRADAKALDQVLVNLIDNAVKYGASPGVVTVRARTVGSQVRLEVQDDGIGLEPAHQKRVFERFYRADASRSREAGGTGLGLAIVKHLAETMGGEVGVMSARPRGTLFWVKLEVATATVPTVAVVESP